MSVNSRHNHVQTYGAGVMVDLEVWLVLGGLARLWLAEARRFLLVVLVQFGQECLVGSFGEHALLLKDRQDTHGLLNTQHKSGGSLNSVYKTEVLFTILINQQ